MICLASVKDEFGSWVENELKRDKKARRQEAAAIRMSSGDGLDQGGGGAEGELDTNKSCGSNVKPAGSAVN